MNLGVVMEVTSDPPLLLNSYTCSECPNIGHGPPLPSCAVSGSVHVHTCISYLLYVFDIHAYYMYMFTKRARFGIE